MPRHNNFDLIRLFAAMQVLNEHAIESFRIEALYPLMYALKFFPGVPIFFIVSGFLVSQSWERAPSARQYAVNRSLRIFPALWACVAISIPIAFASGALTPSPAEFVAWLASQLTVLQFYNPAFLRALPAGGLNGSLWTIPVEMQFYVLAPLLAMVAKKSLRSWLLIALISAGMMLSVRSSVVTRETLVDKILSVSLLPYLFYFVVGVVSRLLVEHAPRVFEGKFLAWGAAYGAWIAIEVANNLDGKVGNLLSVPSILLLAGLTVAAAFTAPRMAQRVLRENDASYGIYVYHLPLINLAMASGVGAWTGYWSVIAATLALGFASWRLIERPALSLKRYTSRPHEAAVVGAAA